ncbi:MAG: hypothetical protein E7481_00460 [Ruminococcaceae bacterium]|nr:hypothetical protein [Oscillospiraceae bacterium]
MALVLFGLICVLVNFGFEFYSTNLGANVMIDILPDFVGYLILYFALEKQESNGRWFRESLSVGVGMLVVSVLVFLSQIQFLFSWTNTLDSKVFALFVSLITAGVNHIGSIIYALTMVFAALFSLAMMSEADKIRHKGWSVTYTVFFMLYVALAAAYVVLQFIQLPFSSNLIALPVNIAFILVFYFSTKTLDVFEGR